MRRPSSDEQIEGIGREPRTQQEESRCSRTTRSRQRSTTAGSASPVTTGSTGAPGPAGTSSTCSAGKPEGRHTMYITPQLIQAETAYKQERTKREFRAGYRRRRAERQQPQLAR